MEIIAKINVEYKNVLFEKIMPPVYAEVPLNGINKVLHDAKMNAIAGFGLSECHDYFDVYLVRDIESNKDSEIARYIIYHIDEDNDVTEIGNVYITYEIKEE